MNWTTVGPNANMQNTLTLIYSNLINITRKWNLFNGFVVRHNIISVQSISLRCLCYSTLECRIVSVLPHIYPIKHQEIKTQLLFQRGYNWAKPKKSHCIYFVYLEVERQREKEGLLRACGLFSRSFRYKFGRQRRLLWPHHQQRRQCQQSPSREVFPQIRVSFV